MPADVAIPARTSLGIDDSSRLHSGFVSVDDNELDRLLNLGGEWREGSVKRQRGESGRGMGTGKERTGSQ